MPLVDAVRRLVAAAAMLVVAGASVSAQGLNGSDAGSAVFISAIEGPIGPATAMHVGRVIDLAGERQAAAVILRMNTPGGLATSMREIISQIQASPVPVIGFVAPAGAHAASAGTYLLYATHLAAMAPGTNLGAATPVQLGGAPPGLPDLDDGGGDEGTEDSRDDGATEREPRPLAGDDAMTAKSTNDAVALIRSLAELHGRNADWAERAVREAASLSAAAALDMNVIDIMADDIEDLLDAADGRTVILGGGEHVLAVADRPLETVEMDSFTRLLSILSNPNVALILMMIGVYGLIFEFWNPGAVVPGVVGAICLTLGLFALNQLPLDYAGLALIGLGIAFMVVEAVTPTFGVLGLGGIVAFVLGASMLVNTDVPAYQVSWWLIGTLAAVSGAVLILLLGFTVRAYRGVPVSGNTRMIGGTAHVLEWTGGQGFVWIEGERWQAKGAANLTPGQSVRVRGVDGLTLIVEAASDQRPERKG